MTDPDSLAPHPTLDRYYESDAARPRFLRSIFDSTSVHYEWIENVLSFGLGIRYRSQVLRAAGFTPEMKHLDVATGTGAVAKAARTLAGSSEKIIGLDPSYGMLRQARKNLGLRTVQAAGEEIPFRSEIFDFITVGYALRHLGDLRKAFGEWNRTLKPGGILLILEISTPPKKGIRRSMLRFYMDTIVPKIVRLGTRSADAEELMHYYWDTTETCVPPETIVKALEESGFSTIHKSTTFGVFTEYRAVR